MPIDKVDGLQCVIDSKSSFDDIRTEIKLESG